jgi:hypothetical protein
VFPIKSLLLFRVKLLPNVFRDVIVTLQWEAFLNVPDPFRVDGCSICKASFQLDPASSRLLMDTVVLRLYTWRQVEA